MIKMTKTRAKKIIEALKKSYVDIKPDLEYNNLYELSISVILSAQTTDKQVNSVTPVLFKKYPDYKHLSKAKMSSVENIIKSVGLYKTKAKNIINLSKLIVEKYNNILPSSLKKLMELPGIGRKSANVILAFGYSEPAFPVDTHVKRLANRIGFINSDNLYEIEMALIKYIEKADWRIGHLLLVKHARNICKARNPMCSECTIRYHCHYYDS